MHSVCDEKQIHLKATVKTSNIWEVKDRERDRDANLPIYNDCPAEWCKCEYLSLGPEKKQDTKQPRENTKGRGGESPRKC